MRKKIGKRIGPVPITLVAVFALAAFISAGFWLVPNGGQTAEAQGLPNTPTAGGGDDECAVIVNGTGAFVEGIVSGGGCTVSDDSVDVMFENADANLDKSIAVYVTGGEQFSSLQAMNTTGMPIGAQGIDEYLLTVPDDEVGFAGTENGSQTVTVSRDMAKNGEVYLFVYLTDTENTKTFDPAAIPLSGLVNDKVRTRTNENTLLAMLSTSSGTIVADANDIRTSALAFDHDNDSGTTALMIIDGTAIPAVTEATPSNQKQADGTTDDSNVIRADVDPEQDTLDMAKAIVAAVKDASQYEAFAEASNNKAEIAALELNIRRAQATIDAIDGGDPDYWPGIVDAPLAVEVVFTNAAATAKLKSDGTYGGPAAPGEEDTYTLGSTLFTGRGSLSSNEPISSGADTADVEVTIRDALGVELSGFVDFSVDTSAAGAADVVIAASSTSNHRVKLNDGVARVQVTDLETNVALKIPVTVSYGSDFEIMGYIVRLGDAMMVEAAAYACKSDSDDGDDGTVCTSEIKALGNTNTSDDPDEVVALGPGQSFVIAGKATDSVGNNVGKGNELSWKITADADNADDAEDTLAADDGKTLEMITVTGDDDAVPGVYSLTVTSPDGEASMMIMITVSDVASMISVSCDPEMIPTDSGLTDCVVMVTDANGNIPSNLINGSADADPDDDSRVLVIVRSEGVSLSGVGEGDYADLDAKGMASFSVVLREDAREGSVTVFVSTDNVGSTTLRTNTTVVYGDAPPEVMEPGTELGKASNVTTGPFNEGGVVQVNWASAPNATGYIIYAVNVDELDDPEGQIVVKAVNDAAAMTYNLEGLNVGANYDIYVVATAPEMAEWPEDADVQHVTAN